VKLESAAIHQPIGWRTPRRGKKEVSLKGRGKSKGKETRGVIKGPKAGGLSNLERGFWEGLGGGRVLKEKKGNSKKWILHRKGGPILSKGKGVVIGKTAGQKREKGGGKKNCEGTGEMWLK